MALDRQEAGAVGDLEGQVEEQVGEQAKLSLSLFRRPDKYRIGEDFFLFTRKLNLYFEAV